MERREDGRDDGRRYDGPWQDASFEIEFDAAADSVSKHLLFKTKKTCVFCCANKVLVVQCSTDAVSALNHLCLALKIIAGDNHTGSQLRSVTDGIDEDKNLHGLDLRKLSDDALRRPVVDVEVCAEIEAIF